MDLIEFTNLIDRQIVIRTHPNFHDGSAYWHADIENCEIKQGRLLKGCFGDGVNPEQALLNLVNNIKGERLVFNASRSNRQEIVAPKSLTLNGQAS